MTLYVFEVDIEAKCLLCNRKVTRIIKPNKKMIFMGDVVKYIGLCTRHYKDIRMGCIEVEDE